MQQMNLFNTSPEVAGFKLDYLEVWNWGTFDQKVYCMNTQGNNSLLTGDRKSTRLNSSHSAKSRMPSSA